MVLRKWSHTFRQVAGPYIKGMSAFRRSRCFVLEGVSDFGRGHCFVKEGVSAFGRAYFPQVLLLWFMLILKVYCLH